MECAAKYRNAKTKTAQSMDPDTFAAFFFGGRRRPPTTHPPPMRKRKKSVFDQILELKIRNLPLGYEYSGGSARHWIRQMGDTFLEIQMLLFTDVIMLIAHDGKQYSFLDVDDKVRERLDFFRGGIRVHGRISSGGAKI